MRRGGVGRLVVAALLLAGGGLAAACGLLGPCREENATVEVRYASPFYEDQVRSLDLYGRNGWDCQRERTLGNWRGDEIGVRYRCTKCA